MELIALGTVKHNHKWYHKGESIPKINKDDGDRLIKLGVATVDEVAERLKAAEAARKKAETEEKKKAEEDAEKLAKKENEKK